MKIYNDSNITDSTYFRTGDCEPYLDHDGNLWIYNGRGTYRSSWGSPQVNTAVIISTSDLVALHIGFSHKHGGGQFWRYLQKSGNDWYSCQWKNLADDQRQMVLDAKRPSWAKSPGKLKSDRAALNKWNAYKIMGYDNGRLFSLYDHNFIYEINKTTRQKSQPDHGGGLYVHKSLDNIMQLLNDGKLINEDWRPEVCALVLCECWGNEINYTNGKTAVSYCKPLEILYEV